MHTEYYSDRSRTRDDAEESRYSSKREQVESLRRDLRIATELRNVEHRSRGFVGKPLAETIRD